MSRPFGFLLSGLILVAFASPGQSFIIEGQVYCDLCGTGFQNTETEPIKGAKVKLECKNPTSGELSQSVDGVTDVTGTYTFKIQSNRDEDICEAVLVSSPREDCNEITGGRDRVRVVLSHDTDTSTSSDIIYADSLFFPGKEPLPGCGPVMEDVNPLFEDEQGI